MNNQLNVVRQRRSELLARITEQREQVAEISVRLQPPLAIADKGLAILRFMRSNLVLIAAVAALLTIRRRGVAGWGQALWSGWELYRLAKSFAEKPPEHP